jgi:hypothetical protein
MFNYLPKNNLISDFLHSLVPKSTSSIIYVVDIPLLWQLFDDILDNGVNIDSVLFSGSEVLAGILLSEVCDIDTKTPIDNSNRYTRPRLSKPVHALC